MAAAFLSVANALIKGGGRRSEGPPISKFCKELWTVNYTTSALRGRTHTVESALPSIYQLEPRGLQRYLSLF